MKIIQAKFDSTGTCGHPIKKGDRIGWDKYKRLTICKECTEQHERDTAAADFDQMVYDSQRGGY